MKARWMNNQAPWKSPFAKGDTPIIGPSAIIHNTNKQSPKSHSQPQYLRHPRYWYPALSHKAANHLKFQTPIGYIPYATVKEQNARRHQNNSHKPG